MIFIGALLFGSSATEFGEWLICWSYFERITLSAHCVCAEYPSAGLAVLPIHINSLGRSSSEQRLVHCPRRLLGRFRYRGE
jgi:hypothetical protein